jgi:hypothetical protein
MRTTPPMTTPQDEQEEAPKDAKTDASDLFAAADRPAAESLTGPEKRRTSLTPLKRTLAAVRTGLKLTEVTFEE